MNAVDHRTFGIAPIYPTSLDANVDKTSLPVNALRKVLALPEMDVGLCKKEKMVLFAVPMRGFQ